MFTAQMPNSIGILRALFPILRFLVRAIQPSFCPHLRRCLWAWTSWGRNTNCTKYLLPCRKWAYQRQASRCGEQRKTNRPWSSLSSDEVEYSRRQACGSATFRPGCHSTYDSTNHVWELSRKSDASHPQKFLPLWLLVTKPPGKLRLRLCLA